jgi:outer membrane biosynthesis protein TonB
MFFYLWLWFIDLYLNNYSASAIEEKRRLAKEGIYVPAQPAFKKRVYEPQPEPVIEYQPQPKPQPVVQPKPQPQPVVQPKPQPVVQPQPVIQPEPIVQPEPVVEAKVEQEPAWVESPISDANSISSATSDVVYTAHNEAASTITTKSNREQLLAWIQEEENKGGK